MVRLKQLFEETGSTYAAINRYLEERRKNMNDAVEGLNQIKDGRENLTIRLLVWQGISPLQC